MVEFLDNIYLVAATLGFTLFELPKRTKTTKKQFKFKMESGVEACGYLVQDGFLVEAGSGATRAEVTSLQGGYQQLKGNLITKGILKLESGKYVFAEEYTFNSSTAAVCVISGSPRSGPASWKDEAGKTLGEFDAEKAKNFEGELKKSAESIPTLAADQKKVPFKTS